MLVEVQVAPGSAGVAALASVEGCGVGDLAKDAIGDPETPPGNRLAEGMNAGLEHRP